MKLCYHCMQQVEDEKLNQCPHCGKDLSAERKSEKFLPPGTVLGGKYVIGHPLGAGGFGNTYIAWNQFLLRRVAIKEFFPEQYCHRAEDGVQVTVSDERLRKRFRIGLQQFLEEARSVASLHEIRGVVSIENFFEANGTGYIVMEYLEGMDVKTILKHGGGRKDYEWSRRVILTILHTLREIHKRGVLHRDIAPDNIFVTNEGVIKLIDFGAARHASALANMKSEIILKSGYAPIEQYSRNAPQGSYTDLYAVAALFYRMLTGQKPLPANERISHDSVIPPSDMGVSLPEQAEMGIMVCLNIQPEFRLQSADDFMEVLDGKNFVPVYEPDWILPKIAEDGSLSGRIRRLSRPVKAAICIGCICAALGIAAGGITFYRNHDNAGLQVTAQNDDSRMKDYHAWNVEEAKADLNGKGFSDIRVIYERSNEEEGTIISQKPQGGEELVTSVLPEEAGSSEEESARVSEIVFTVSGGQDTYTLDNFTERTDAELEDMIAFFTSQNIEVELDKIPNHEEKNEIRKASGNPELPEVKGKVHFVWNYTKPEEAQKGVCYDQSQAAGEVVTAEGEIKLYFSLGNKSDYEKRIPDLTGKTVEEAQELLKEAGFEHTEIEEGEKPQYSRNYAAGKIISQDPAPTEDGDPVNILENPLDQIHVEISSGTGKRKK